MSWRNVHIYDALTTAYPSVEGFLEHIKHVDGLSDYRFV